MENQPLILNSIELKGGALHTPWAYSKGNASNRGEILCVLAGLCHGGALRSAYLV